MGLGADLMRFFAFDGVSRAADPPLNLTAFHLQHQAEYPYPAQVLTACSRLCDAGRLYRTGNGIGMPVTEATYAHLQTVADLQPELDYGTYDFIVGGFPAVRKALAGSVALLEVDLVQKVAQGSGFAAASNVLITARHCVEHADSVMVHHESGSVHEPAEIVLPDSPAFDLAALVLREAPFEMPLRGRPAEVLEGALTLGYPHLQGLKPALIGSVGEVAGSATAYLADTNLWVTTCSMTGGSSGGPVLAADGRVIGVVSAFPANDAGVDPGRFGLMTAFAEAPASFLREALGKGMEELAKSPH